MRKRHLSEELREVVRTARSEVPMSHNLNIARGKKKQNNIAGRASAEGGMRRDLRVKQGSVFVGPWRP